MYPETTTTATSDITILFIYLIVIAVLFLWNAVVFYRLSVKAGLDNAWMNFVPILNYIPFCHLVKWSGWMTLLYFIPGVNSIVAIIHYYKILKAFGRSGWMLLLIYFIPFFVVFYMLYLAYSEEVQYEW